MGKVRTDINRIGRPQGGGEHRAIARILAGTLAHILGSALGVCSLAGMSPLLAQTVAQTVPPPPETIPIEPLEPLPPPPRIPQFERPVAPAEFGRYRLGAGDAVFVNVLRFPDLSLQGMLDVEGNLFIPLVGAVNLQGATIPEARNRIQVALDRFIINPEVDVILVAARPVRVTVLGEVASPGAYVLDTAQLSTALITAGGTTGSADLRRVRVRRTAATGAAERTIDLFSPLVSASGLPDLRLEDGDTLVVPALTSETRSDYNAALVARSNLAQPEISVRVLDYSASRGGGNVRGDAMSLVTLPSGSTFIDAIATISPNPDTASFRSVALIRFDPGDERAIALRLNARDALRGDTSQNPLLQHNDVIIVGRNLVGRVLSGLNTFAQPFRDVVGFLLFFDALDRATD